MQKCSLFIAASLLVVAYSPLQAKENKWSLVDNFQESKKSLSAQWHIRDVQNETIPFVESPQVAEIKQEPNSSNRYYLKKAAQNGVIGNRKALSYIRLAREIKVGEIATFYTRIMVESFPNNHSFGLSNQTPSNIDTLSYNAFEPMLRITDKTESNGLINTGALMIIRASLNGKAQYQDVNNEQKNQPAQPLQVGEWYEVWYVVNNQTKANGGQRYSVYMRGGEFEKQQRVYQNAEFRMQREADLQYFVTISNTGPQKQPYGNGGLAFDDIYMTEGIVLNRPFELSNTKTN